MLRVIVAAGLLIAVSAATAGETATGGTAARESADAPERSADKGDRIVCKPFPQIGSLVATYKTCKTVREWRQERATIQQGSGGADSCRLRGSVGGC